VWPPNEPPDSDARNFDEAQDELACPDITGQDDSRPLKNLLTVAPTRATRPGPLSSAPGNTAQPGDRASRQQVAGPRAPTRESAAPGLSRGGA
jgi:hypothetical protein